MRRRDGDNHATRRRANLPAVIGAFALSAGLHATLIFVVTLLEVPITKFRPLIWVSLRAAPSPGGGDAGGTDPQPASLAPEVARDEVTFSAHNARTRMAGGPKAMTPKRVAKASAPRVAAEEEKWLVEKTIAANGMTGAGPGRESAVGIGAGKGFMGSGGGRGVGGGIETGTGEARSLCEFCPEPVYPIVARVRGWEGTVEVALEVQADGQVGAASLQRSSGFRALDDAAVRAAQRSRFRLPEHQPLQGFIQYRFELSRR